MPRRTKIIATLGPATDSPEKMQALIQAGVNLVRINLSHGRFQDHEQRILLARECAKTLGKPIGILVDLQGPKIRIGRFKDPDGVLLVENSLFNLDPQWPLDEGDETIVSVDYPNLAQEVNVGDQILLDDGRLVLMVIHISGSCVQTQVKTGGTLLSRKGLNRKGGGLSVESLTEKDKKDITLIAPLAVDYVALSFPKDAKDIHEVRALVHQSGSEARIVAKIERAEAITHIDEIIDAADAVMVARGDLGVEIGYPDLPGVQKHIIHNARSREKAVITATQMMESMIHNSIPTRAEVSDVANAVLDGTDAVMLSAETATGDFPIKVVSVMDEICLSAERYRGNRSNHQDKESFERSDKAIAKAAMYIAHHIAIKAIVTLTESGSAPLWMSRVRSGIPIYALSRHPRTCGRVTLFRGVYPIDFDLTQYKPWEISHHALKALVERGILEEGDKVILTKGDILGVGGYTNALKILTVPAFNH